MGESIREGSLTTKIHFLHTRHRHLSCDGQREGEIEGRVVEWRVFTGLFAVRGGKGRKNCVTGSAGPRDRGAEGTRAAGNRMTGKGGRKGRTTNIGSCVSCAPSLLFPLCCHFRRAAHAHAVCVSFTSSLTRACSGTDRGRRPIRPPVHHPRPQPPLLPLRP